MQEQRQDQIQAQEQLQKITKCIICECIITCCEYVMLLDDGRLDKVFACNRCANSLKLITEKEMENTAKMWWRNHMTIKAGKPISTEVFEKCYEELLSSVVKY